MSQPQPTPPPQPKPATAAEDARAMDDIARALAAVAKRK